MGAALPTVLCDLPLSAAWGYKFDDRLQAGIGLHADMAAVNVNLWITPDEHNLDGSTGGLVIYDAVADPDMSFAEYNAGNDMFVRQKMLEATEYRNVTIPYRQNRAVIFDSARIHGTQPFSFS